MYVIPPINNDKICQGGELNSRPRAYESPALPLSYLGSKRSENNIELAGAEVIFKKSCMLIPHLNTTPIYPMKAY